MANRVMDMLRGLKGLNVGSCIDLYDHSLQSATRALRDGADVETVVCALLHDVGELLAPICHGEVAGSLLRPYISPKNYWVLIHHEIFQAYYYGDAMNVDKDARDRFRAHPYYDACEEFCRRWDENSFDPDYDNLPLEHFAPMVQAIFERDPYSLAGHMEEPINEAKASLSNYDFNNWLTKN